MRKVRAALRTVGQACTHSAQYRFGLFIDARVAIYANTYVCSYHSYAISMYISIVSRSQIGLYARLVSMRCLREETYSARIMPHSCSHRYSNLRNHVASYHCMPALHPADTCGGPREDLGATVAEYVLPGRQVILSDTIHEFTGCGEISRWSMIFSCSGSSGGVGYALELQVFSQNVGTFSLLRTAQVTLTDEQCGRQLVSFNISLPICQRDHVGMYVPDSPGITGLGYWFTGSFLDTFVYKELPAPPSVGDSISFGLPDTEFRDLPLVSIEGVFVASNKL